MKKIDLYILKKQLTTFVFVVAILLVIICVIDFTEKNDDYIKHQVSREEILRYYLSFIPYFAVLLTPITAFIATVFVTAQLASRTEVIAILASGISFKRMLVPYFIGACLIGIFSFIFINYVIPDANKYRIAFELQYFNKPFYFSDRNIHFKIGENDYVFIDRYNNQRDVGYAVTLERIHDEEMLAKITARRMEWDSVKTSWSLKDWQLREIKENGEIITSGNSLDTVLALSPTDFQNNEYLHETLILPRLNDYIELQRSRGADDVQIYLIEKYIRFMQPFTVIILCFMGVIVSARKTRRGTGFQIALGFTLAFAFVIFFVLARAIAEAGSMNPILAVWLPNITFSIVAMVMYNAVPR